MAKKILLIEEDNLIVSVLQRRLMKAGYEFRFAKDSKEGLAKIKKAKPDIALIDLSPSRSNNGSQTLKVMAADPVLKDIPVIAIFNSSRPEEINKAMEMGVKDQIAKTEFDPQDVLDKIKEYIGQ